jgi:hypothetical protein
MALFFGQDVGVAMNDGTKSLDEGQSRRVIAADDADDQRPEPHAEPDDQTPEEAGYGYGV